VLPTNFFEHDESDFRSLAAQSYRKFA
jgi:hypothetical protein